MAAASLRRQASQICLFNIAMESNQGCRERDLRIRNGSGIYINTAFRTPAGRGRKPSQHSVASPMPATTSASCNYFFGNKATDQSAA